MECPHGRMPFDPCPSPDGQWPHPGPCGCFGAEVEAPRLEVVRPAPKQWGPPNPSGLCMCGCGEPTRRAPVNGYGGRYRKGDAVMFVKGHAKANRGRAAA